ncbi:hypothetical protein M3Y94_01026700 [Aphelenchoides besseyi]|nr:hypothetical protein M3Y94_01026700 [Aphelenchoides besseyi]KAI6223866.1 hypothetical protein M3Y95_00821800 [Aphelenchoides besseyi]
MSEVRPPKLLPQAAAAFFQHFITADCQVLPLQERKQAIRLMNVSNSFCLVAHDALRNSVVDVRLASVCDRDSNMWILRELETPMMTEQTALAVFKLARPEIKKLIAVEYSRGSTKAIDEELISCLTGVSEYEIWSEAEYTDNSAKLAEQLSSNGHLKSLECKWGNLINDQELEPLNVEKFSGEFDLYKAPRDFTKLLHHKFRQIRLQMRCFADDNDVFDEEDRDVNYRVPMIELSKTTIVQPSIEEIYLENLTDRFQADEPWFLPLEFYKHVPNLKKLFYSTHQSAVKNYYGQRPTQATQKLVNFLDFMFKHVKEALKNGSQAQFIFAINTTVFLNVTQNEKSWMEEFVRLPLFANFECELTSKKKMCDDPSFRSTPLYDRFQCKSCPTSALICTASNMKLFLWGRFGQLMDAQEVFDEEMDEDFEDEEEWEDEEDDFEEMDYEEMAAENAN